MEKTIMAIEQVAGVLKLFGDKTRLAMISLLAHNECCVCEFVEIFQMSQPAISQHLRKLKDSGLVKERRSGQWMFFSLNKENEAYPLIRSLLPHVPDQKERLEALEAEGLRMSCCD
ncbi:transcriptional regulator [Pullulanibacillus camelliae]|uniref:Transcriptional regulator n=1 Tax=Pullulanibacillus camelliae TaxID=1707096 RepID=A0A8J2YMA0_9BACL|nr:metalloregulator ArsR/SmtB family transcription factor [Pullulanibacillus camelliae]GGE52648.1 transcriptional regulator [Pullulanibacillus camelliae]